jgi:hypothetical protein
MDGPWVTIHPQILPKTQFFYLLIIVDAMFSWAIWPSDRGGYKITQTRITIFITISSKYEACPAFNAINILTLVRIVWTNGWNDILPDDFPAMSHFNEMALHA